MAILLQLPTPLPILTSSRRNPFHANYLGFSPVCGYIPRARIRLFLSLSRYMDMDLNMESVRFIWRYGVIGGGQAGTTAHCSAPSHIWGFVCVRQYVLVCVQEVVLLSVSACIHRKKSFSIFPSPAGMSLTKLSLGGNNLYMTSLFPPRESLVIDIPAGDGNIEKLFLRCIKLPGFIYHNIDCLSSILVCQCANDANILFLFS